MPAILDGIRIIDMGIWLIGPLGAAYLADLGADVIHVEQLGSGDPMRGARFVLGKDISLPGGRHQWMECGNRGKRSIAVNAQKSEGRQIIYDLVKKSAVFVTNFRADSLARLGLDYENLRRQNEKLIYLHSTGFGSKGPMAKVGAYDAIGLARAGIMCSGANPDMPENVAGGLGDGAGAMLVANAILGALLARERYGIGQLVETSQFGAVMVSIYSNLSSALFSGEGFPAHRRDDANNPIWNWYKCKDGRWIMLSCMQYERLWPICADAFGLSHLKNDKRFENAQQAKKNRKELIAILDQVFAMKSLEEWEKILADADIVFTRINKIEDLASDPQAIENELIVDFDDPELGKIKIIGQPVKYSVTPSKTKSLAPQYAQHTEEVLLDVCGYDWDKISLLKERNVI